MNVCVDVDYRPDRTVAACVGFDNWLTATPVFEKIKHSSIPPAEYEPGQFYKREMPYVLELLGTLTDPPDVVVIDGFVWLDGGKSGFGARLHDALDNRVAVIGVAKRPFQNATNITRVMRGVSQQPLFVSSVGIDRSTAAETVARMHGPYRVPTLLKRVDQLSRA